MRTSNNSYLRLMRHAITETIAPELSSDAAKRSANILLGSIDELLKRETVMPPMLAHTIPAGIDIARRLALSLEQAGVNAEQNARQRLDALAAALGGRTAPSLLTEDCLALEEVMVSLMLPCLDAVRNNASAGRELTALMQEAAEWKQSIAAQRLMPLPPEPDGPAPLLPLTAEKVLAFLRGCLPNESALEVLDFYALPGGMSKQTYRFKLKRGDGTIEEMVARKAPPQVSIDVSCFYLHREFEFTRCLFQYGYLLPEPLWLARDFPGVSGDFYVMRKVEGGNSGGLFSTSAIPESIMLEMAEAMARLHRVPMEVFRGYIERHEDTGLLTDTASESTRRYLVNLIDAWKQVKSQPDCGVIFMMAWALANIPENNDAPVPLHGDLTPHNCLWNEGHLTAVIDWECGDFGDPVIDLAYIKPHIASRMDWDKFLNHYEKHAGNKVNRDSFGYYESLLNIRSWIACNVISARVENRELDDIIMLNVDYEYEPMYIKMSIDSTKTKGSQANKEAAS